MVVETAKIRDLDELVQIGEAFQQESPLHARMEYDPEKAKRFGKHLITPFLFFKILNINTIATTLRIQVSTLSIQ